MISCNKSLACCVALLLLTAGAAPAQDDSPPNDNPWHALAAYWSPLLLQSTRDSFVNDVLTSFDFDGDWDGTNNHDAIKGSALPSTVYYWIIETDDHHYIGYAFYHLSGIEGRGTEDQKDYAHEMQGIVIAIQKSNDNPMGRFLSLTTWGDGRKTFYVEQTAVDSENLAASVWQDSVVFADDPPSGSRDINFMLDSHGFHPVVYGEAGHHAIYGEKSETAFPEGPALYESQPVTDQREALKQRDAMSEARRTFGHRPGRATFSASASGGVPNDDGLIYRHEDFAQHIIGARTRGRGTILHHWNLTGYELQSLSAFWDRRDDQQLFDAAGVFASNQETGPSSRAPWTWRAVFFDPAGYFDELDDSENSGQSPIAATSFATVEELAGEFAAEETDAQ